MGSNNACLAQQCLSLWLVSRYDSNKRRANHSDIVWSDAISSFNLSAVSKQQLFVVLERQGSETSCETALLLWL